MQIRYALAEFIKQMISLILENAGMGFFVLPLLMLRWVVRFLRWGVGLARGGGDLEDLQDEYQTQRERARQAPERFRQASGFRRRY